MKVFIEYVIIDNLIINYLLLDITRKSLKLDVKFYTVLLASIVGTIFAVLLPLFKLSIGFAIAIKILLAMLLTFLAGEHKTLSSFLMASVLLLVFTFAFGGTVYAVFEFLSITFILNGSFLYDTFIPIGIIIAIAYCTYRLLNCLIKKLYTKRTIEQFKRECVVVINGMNFSAHGFIDTGNHLYHDKTYMPILICSNDLSRKIITSGIVPIEPFDVLNINSVGGESTLSVYKIDKIKIYNGSRVNIIINVLIALSTSELSRDKSFDLLLHPAII